MKYFTALALTLASFSLNADPTVGVEKSYNLQIQDEDVSIYHEDYSRRFIPYLRLGPELANPGKGNVIMPGFGLGFRSESNTGAVDCSASYAQYETKEGKKILHVYAPKLIFSRFLNPHSPSAFFAGLGSTWAHIKDRSKNHEFTGLAAVGNFGIEYGRNSKIRQLYQIDVHQPVLALYASQDITLPTIEASFSLGF